MIDRRAIMRRWADATRHMRWDEADAAMAGTNGGMAETTGQSINVLEQTCSTGEWLRLSAGNNALAIDDAEWDIRRRM